jgi:hypothetical protein
MPSSVNKGESAASELTYEKDINEFHEKTLGEAKSLAKEVAEKMVQPGAEKTREDFTEATFYSMAYLTEAAKRFQDKNAGDRIQQAWNDIVQQTLHFPVSPKEMLHLQEEPPEVKKQVHDFHRFRLDVAGRLEKATTVEAVEQLSPKNYAYMSEQSGTFAKQALEALIEESVAAGDAENTELNETCLRTIEDLVHIEATYKELATEFFAQQGRRLTQVNDQLTEERYFGGASGGTKARNTPVGM